MGLLAVGGGLAAQHAPAPARREPRQSCSGWHHAAEAKGRQTLGPLPSPGPCGRPVLLAMRDAEPSTLCWAWWPPWRPRTAPRSLANHLAVGLGCPAGQRFRDGPDDVPGHARAGETRTPVRLDRGHLLQGSTGHPPACARQAYHPGAPVARVDPSFEIAALLQHEYEFAHRLVGHASSGGELGEAGAARVEVLEDGLVGGVQPSKPSRGQPGNKVLDHDPGSSAEHADDRGDRSRPLYQLHLLDNRRRPAQYYAGLLRNVRQGSGTRSRREYL